jgi:hypothetical protein
VSCLTFRLGLPSEDNICYPKLAFVCQRRCVLQMLMMGSLCQLLASNAEAWNQLTGGLR